jgi:hypothetical protein
MSETTRSLGKTPVPNILLDGVMPRMTGGGWKALCYLCRIIAREGPAAEADLGELALATGEEEEDLAYDLEYLLEQRLIDQRVTVPGDRIVYWLLVDDEEECDDGCP